MIDKNKLRGAAMAHGFTFGKLAKAIGITPETLNRNIAKNSLGVNHVKCIQELLHLSDNEVLEIFLSQQVLKLEYVVTILQIWRCTYKNVENVARVA